MFFRKSPKYAKDYNDFGEMETEKKYIFITLWITISIILSVLLINKTNM